MGGEKLRVAITGANGYLASLIRLYNGSEFEVLPITRADLDLSDVERVRAYFEHLDFDVCLHMAADATTAHCESDPAGAHRVNTESAIEIARVCHERGKRLVFFSTEQCFNASPGCAPFEETDKMASTTRYGQQKIEADEWIRENLDNYVVLRLSWMFGFPMPGARPAPNIVTNVASALRTGKPASFRVHERRNMTYALLLANSMSKIVDLPSGAYHFASQNGLNTYETARLVAAKMGCDQEKIDQLILPDYETYADRPRDFRLASKKIEAAGIYLGTFEENLDACLEDFGLA